MPMPIPVMRTLTIAPRARVLCRTWAASVLKTPVGESLGAVTLPTGDGGHWMLPVPRRSVAKVTESLGRTVPSVMRAHLRGAPGAQGLGARLVIEQREYGVGEVGGAVGQLDVLARYERQALGSHRGRDNRKLHGHALENLETGPTADAEGNDHDAGAFEIGSYIRNRACHRDPGDRVRPSFGGPWTGFDPRWRRARRVAAAAPSAGCH